jgi:O-antigen ligase
MGSFLAKLQPRIVRNAWFGWAVFAFYAFLLLVKDSFGLFAVGLVGMSVVAVLEQRPWRLLPLDRVFAWLLAAFPLLMLPSFLVNAGSLRYFDYPIRALLFVPLIIGLRSYAEPKTFEAFLFRGASTGGLFAAVFSAGSLILFPAERVGLPITNPIAFGQIAAILALLALAGLCTSTGRWQKIYCGLGCLGAVVAVCASGSAGALMGLLFGFLVQIVLLIRASKKPAYAAIAIALVVISAFILWPLAAYKFEQITNDTTAFLAGKGMGTSQGMRLIAIEIALRNFSRQPILGVGPGNGHQVIADYCRVNLCTDGFQGWTGMHNQYLDILLTSGLVGLAGWLIFSLGIAWLFYGRYCAGVAPIISAAGLSIVVAMMISAFPQPLYNHNISVISFFFTITFLWFLACPGSRLSAGVPGNV